MHVLRNFRVFLDPAVQQRSIVMSVSVCVCCVFVCLSANISPELHVQSSPVLCVAVAMAGSSYSGVAIRCVFPFLRTTSCLHTMASNRRREIGGYIQCDTTGDSTDWTIRHILNVTHQGQHRRG